MHLGVYNDWLQTQHNAKLRSAQVCHVNFPSTLQHTVIWAAFKMATTFFLLRVHPLPPYDAQKTFQLDCDGLFGPFDPSPF